MVLLSWWNFSGTRYCRNEISEFAKLSTEFANLWLKFEILMIFELDKL
jgi:hypothetical protein